MLSRNIQLRYGISKLINAATLGGILLLFCFLLSNTARAQTADSADKIRITIAGSERLEHFKTDSGEFTKFINDVVLYQGTDTLYCDSLYQNSTTKNFEAFGNVRLAQQGGTEALCDYLRYTADKKLAYMRGNVRLTDGKNTLWCEELNYDVGTKTGIYTTGGTLQSDTTTVSSTIGIYNVKSKESRFTENVIVTHPDYNIRSKDMGYNTETKVSTFYAASTVTSDSGRSILQTNKGTYDSKRNIAHFMGRSSIWNQSQYIEADSIHYNGVTSYGMAKGNVISLDTAQHSWLYCGYAEYFRKKRVLWAMIKPVLVQVNNNDTLYMRADTFYSAPMERLGTVSRKLQAVRDSANAGEVVDEVLDKAERKALEKQIKKAKKGKAPMPALPVKKEALAAVEEEIIWGVPAMKVRITSVMRDTIIREVKRGKKSRDTKLQIADTTEADTTAPLFFIGYHHVLIFSDSLQGKCDSVCYTRSDSVVRMIYNPIAWSRNSQITGDTILIKMDSSAIRSLYVPNNAIVVSQSGPDKAQMYDQVQGRTLTAWFADNQIHRMLVFPEAECIYYSKDEEGAYVGVDEGKSEKMHILFENQKIRKILFETDPKHILSPLDKVDIPNLHLSRFKWLIDEKPKSKEELFQ
jgi:lipopolysaccharide export system protein LptA